MIYICRLDKQFVSRLVIGTHLSKQVTIQDLEHLIETKLAETLHGVSDEGGCPSLSEPSHTIFPDCDRESIKYAPVLFRVHLKKDIQLV